MGILQTFGGALFGALLAPPVLVPLADALRSRNVSLCSLIGGAKVAWLIIGTTFYPLYLLNVVHATDGQMSCLMSVLGIVQGIAEFAGGVFAPFGAGWVRGQAGNRTNVCATFGGVGVPLWGLACQAWHSQVSTILTERIR